LGDNTVQKNIQPITTMQSDACFFVVFSFAKKAKKKLRAVQKQHKQTKQE
jgi:SUMO ligase MMS21 Smc5/6 complex component